VERLLRSSDELVANAVATGTLEEIWRAHESGFDASTVDRHLGREARRYLLRWHGDQAVGRAGGASRCSHFVLDIHARI